MNKDVRKLLNAIRKDGYEKVVEHIKLNSSKLNDNYRLIGDVDDSMRYVVFLPPLAANTFIIVRDFKNNVEVFYKLRKRCFCFNGYCEKSVSQK